MLAHNTFIEYNEYKTCGANNGRAGTLIDGDCQNCRDTRQTGAVSVHTNLIRTDAELAKTFAIIPTASVAAITCQMERISREGFCGKPATHKWHSKEGYIMVCDQCIMGVYLCGGDLAPIAPRA